MATVDPQKVRKTVLELSCRAKSAHAGSSLSCVEILVCLFSQKYGEKKVVEKIVMSKGHASMALYATARHFDFLTEEDMNNYLNTGSRLWGHPAKTKGLEFIEWSTGSLGHGLPVATGWAYARQKLSRSEGLIVALLSDGECDEGSNWEAALFAAHHKLSNLVVIVDYNKIQSFGACKDVINLEPFVDKWRAFNWNVVEVDGHSMEELTKSVISAQGASSPNCIIAHTIKGKGVPAIEDTLRSHYKPITEEQLRDFSNEK